MPRLFGHAKSWLKSAERNSRETAGEGARACGTRSPSAHHLAERRRRVRPRDPVSASESRRRSRPSRDARVDRIAPALWIRTPSGPDSLGDEAPLDEWFHHALDAGLCADDSKV